jgi:hypothetical protein
VARLLDGSFVNLLFDALVKAMWFKRTLRIFLRQHGVSEAALATWAEGETKREFLDRLLSRLAGDPRSTNLLLALARDLAEQSAFPDLQGLEDGPQRIAAAREATQRLHVALKKMDQQVRSEQNAREARERRGALLRQSERTSKQLRDLETRLQELARQIGTQDAGYEFERWFYDFVDHFEVMHRRPYRSGDLQYDGSVTVDGTTYLVELKFTKERAGPTAVSHLEAKVRRKADNTMAVLVSMAGFTAPAVEHASSPRSVVLLLDASHIYRCLAGAQSFAELIQRAARHAAQTGQAYASVSEVDT